MKRAAGILFFSKKGNALFLQRAKTSAQFPLAWCFPGGTTEGEETAEETGRREAQEEVGKFPKGELKFHTRTRTIEADGQGIGTPPPGPANVVAAPPSVPTAAPPSPQAPEQVDFTTFMLQVDEEFTPILNEEHTGFAWAPVAAAPQPLHPGCQIALDRISMNELGVARAIADGRLTSPQYYVNMWLFAIRITGTDVAYRNSLDEFVYRDPKLYLNDEFLARCNGLQVLYRQRSGKEGGFHPKGALLTPKEFVERVVGSIFLPYISGDEVWGIAKIYDAACASDMEEGRASSTSPAVFFAEVSVNSKLQLESGSTLLVEGDPSLLDHVCICEQGVWDKAGEPTGVRAEARGDTAMAEDDAKKDAEEHDKEKADASEGAHLDKALSHIMDAVEGLHKRMDAIEEEEKERSDAKRRKDAEEEKEREKADSKRRKDEEEEKEKADEDEDEAERLAADAKKKKRKDAEEEDKENKEKAKGDARGDAALPAAEVLAQVDKLRAEMAEKLPKRVSDADFYAVTDAQRRADAIYTLFGKHAPRPVDGDTVQTYERACVKELKEHSQTWKGLESTSAAFADDVSFAVIRDQVYADAERAGRSPSGVAAGTLRMVTRESGGHTINEFMGEPRSWMDPIAGPLVKRAEGGWKIPQGM